MNSSWFSREYLAVKTEAAKVLALRLFAHFKHPRRAQELVAVLLILLLVWQGAFYNTRNVKAATYTFVQTSWAGGADTVNFPSHTNNQSGWTKYYSLDSGAVVTAGAVKMEISTTTQTLAQTTATDFSSGTAGAGSFVVGANNGGGVALCTYDHGGADWTPSDNDGIYDLNGATAGIYIAGTHCNIGTFSIPSGTVYVMPYDGSKYGRLKIYATTVSVAGTLSAASSGYPEYTGPGSVGGGADGPGGSYGGNGGGATGKTYGNLTTPTDLGSGGWLGCDHWQTPAGHGGGAIYLNASGAMTIGGNVDANGGNGSNRVDAICGATYSSGGGSGGSVYLSASSLAGAGSITANGGGVTGNGGGGGRVAYYYTSSTFSGTVTASGGSSPYLAGSAGTVNNGDAGSYPGPIGYLFPSVKKSFLGIKMAHAASAQAIFTSSVQDTGVGQYRTFGAIRWTGGTSTTASIKFQVASSNSAGGPWTYYGPTGALDFYTVSSTTLNSTHHNQRYIRYQMTLDSTESLFDTPVLQSVSIGYDISAYPTSKNLVSSPYNAVDSANIPDSLAWTEDLPSGTDIKFQVRTAPDSAGTPGSWTAWMGPGGSDATYFTDSAGGEAMPAGLSDGASDQWMQYKLFLVSDGSATPTLSSMTVTYVVNAPPNFNPAYGSSGLTVSQVSSSGDANWGNVQISYSVRDTDTTSGSVTRGYITPSFEYDLDDGLGWRAIASQYLVSGDTSNKAVDVTTYMIYNAYWNAKGQVPNLATTTARIRVTANDNEAANNTASVSVSDVGIDTTAPILSVKVFNSALGRMTLMASDTLSNIQYNISNDSTLAADGTNAISGAWQTVGDTATSTIFSWTGSGSAASEPVYLLVRDAYNNAIATTTVRAPKVPSNIDIKDASNVTTGEYRILTSWPVYSNESGATFVGYEVSRSTNGTDYSLLTTVADIAQNYYLDPGLATTSTYYYKTNVLDTDGDRSRYTAVVSEVPNGVNSISNDTIAPTVSAVSYGTPQSTYATITWTTDEAANSRVEYSTAAANNYASIASSTSYVSSHSVVLPTLTSGTSYVFRVKSTDLAGNLTTSSSGTYAFTTATAMVISGVTATGLTNTSATVTWNTDADADSYVVYATSAADLLSGTNATTTGTATLAGGAGPSYSHSVGLSSLLENTTYYYYVKSTDAPGNIITENNSGSYYTFTTTYDTTAPTITGVTVALKTSDSAVITWTTNEASDSQITWGASAGAPTASSTRNATLTLNHSATMSSLSASTKYYYQVNSADSHGNRATSTEDNLTTTAGDQTITNTVFVTSGGGGVSSVIGIEQKEYDKVKAERDKLTKQLAERDTAAPIIKSVSVSDIKPFAATLNVVTNEPAFAMVQFGMSEDLLDKTVSGREYSASSTIALYGLRFGTDYYLNITASDKAGNISLATTSAFKTQYAAEATDDLKTLDNAENYQNQLEGIIDSVLPSLVPPQIADIKATDITEDTAVISWSTNSKTYGSVLYAPNDVLKDKGFSSSSPMIMTLSDASNKERAHTLMLKNLSPLTTYQYKISSFAIFGASSESKIFKFTTKAPKVRPEISNITTTSFTVFWKTNEPTTSVVEYTNKKTGTVARVTKEERVKNHTVTVENLTPDTLYAVAIFGVADNGVMIEATQALAVRTKLDSTPPAISGMTISNTIIPNKSDRLQTVITWKTDEPATSLVAFEEGTGSVLLAPQFSENVETFSENHAIILTRFKPGTVYRVQVASTDRAENSASSTVKTILTPRQSDSVFNVIIKNFDDTFGYLNSSR